MPTLLQRLNALVDTTITKFNALQANKQDRTGTFPAEQLTGTINVARLPVLPGSNTIANVSAISALTTAQQNEVVTGSTIILADGRSFRYSGTGSKTVEASYIFVADQTPDWSTLQNVPADLLRDTVYDPGDLSGRLTTGLTF